MILSTDASSPLPLARSICPSLRRSLLRRLVECEYGGGPGLPDSPDRPGRTRPPGLGLTNRVAPAGDLVDQALAFAAEVAAGPPIAHRLMKENLNRATHHELKECLAAEAVAMTRAGQTDDHKEAAKAFVEKRSPVFAGR